MELKTHQNIYGGAPTSIPSGGYSEATPIGQHDINGDGKMDSYGSDTHVYAAGGGAPAGGEWHNVVYG